MPEKKTVEQFIEEANKLWKNAYDYSNVVYISSNVPVEIICHKHGLFHQRPDSHLTGHKCPKCSRQNLSQEEALNRCYKVHGDTYTYENFLYEGIHTNVAVNCRIHGAFTIRPDNFWNGQGCKNCNALKPRIPNYRTTEQFIIDARKVHGDRYDYSLAEYKGNKVKLVIVCMEHGSFLQEPRQHLSGHNCYLCSRYSRVGKPEW